MDDILASQKTLDQLENEIQDLERKFTVLTINFNKETSTFKKNELMADISRVNLRLEELKARRMIEISKDMGLKTT